MQNKVVNSALSGKSDIGHEHTSDEIHYAYDQNVSVTTILENKAPKHHTHDDRYYTEAEIDEKLNGKADSNHRHNDVSILKQVDNDWVALPVWYMIKMVGVSSNGKIQYHTWQVIIFLFPLIRGLSWEMYPYLKQVVQCINN